MQQGFIQDADYPRPAGGSHRKIRVQGHRLSPPCKRAFLGSAHQPERGPAQASMAVVTLKTRVLLSAE